MQTLIPFTTVLMQAVGWSLIHSIWQGGIIYLMLLVIYRAFPGMNATLRHNCSVIGLLLLMLWTINTAYSQFQTLHRVAVQIIPGDATRQYIVEVSAENMHANSSYSFARLNQAMPVFTACYFIGLLVMLFRLGGGLSKIYRLRKEGVSLVNDKTNQLLEGLRLRLGMAEKIAVKVSSRVAVPVVIGILRPLILLPHTVAEELDDDSLETILLHELAHICRADFLINIFQSIVETLLFFNPFAWCISGIIRREREHCCDDIVLSHANEPLSYARALASLAGLPSEAASSIALAATGQQHHLLNRIKRIIEMKKSSRNYGRAIAACSIVAILIIVSIACFTPTFAQHAKKSKSTGQDSDNSRRSSHNVYVVDSDGVQHHYKSIDEMPPAQQAKVRKALKEADQQTAAAEEQIALATEALSTVDEDSINELVNRSVGKSLNAAELGANIHIQIDSAMQAIKNVDWDQISKEINNGIDEAMTEVNNPKIRKQIRRQIASARREVAIAMRERQRILKETRRDLEETQRDMKQMRKDDLRDMADRMKDEQEALKERRQSMEETRRELQRTKEELKETRKELLKERGKLDKENGD